MKITKPSNIALLSILIISFSAIGFFLLFQYVVPDNVFFIVALTILSSSVVGYISIRTIVEFYLAEKIRLIQKNIHATKVSRDEEYKLAKSSDLDAIDSEVGQWSNDYNSEIDQLKNREKFRREFLGNVSHELKTPIFNIQGYILTLLDGGLEDENINIKYLKRASKSVDRMIDLIQDMDTINKLESGIMDLKVSNFNIVDLVKEVLDMLEDKAKVGHVSIGIKSHQDKELVVNADPKRIEQVLINLINNAIKYNNIEGGKVEVSFYDLEDKYLVEVSDNGQGIPEADLPRVFERFYRVDKSRVRSTGGSGLGLSIVKHIIDSHRQTIHLKSAEGAGTTFSFTLQKA